MWASGSGLPAVLWAWSVPSLRGCATIMDKLDERYKKLALEAKAWIEAITGRSFGDGDFIEELSDGVMLCRYVCMWGLRCSGGLFEQLWSRTVVMYTTLCCCAVPPIRSHRAHVCLVWVPAVLVAQADEEAAPWIGKVHQQIQDAVCAPSTRHWRRAYLACDRQSLTWMVVTRQENISCALRACRAFGQTEFEMFETEDLASFKNVTQVVSALHSLGRTVQEKRPDIEHTLGLKVKKGVRLVGSWHSLPCAFVCDTPRLLAARLFEFPKPLNVGRSSKIPRGGRSG